MFINHSHYYDWIVSWEFNQENQLIFAIGRSNATESLWYYFHHVSDVKEGINQAQRYIDKIRVKYSDIKIDCMSELDGELYKLTHPPDYENPDSIPF